ncbi:MAG: hypothetical protein GY811_30920 [Myxococcales bacterium]|nr:hypothetical protein [Myxococcales bacterium]
MMALNIRVALTTVLACGVLLSCDPEEDKEAYTVLADRIPGGTLLSMASMGDEAVFVGGQLDGGKGVIVRYDGETICYEEDVTDRALWWIHSAREGEFYAVGEAGTIIHSVDGQRTDESVATSSTLFGVFDAGDRVIAVGGDVFGTKEGEVWIRENGTWILLQGGLPGVAFKAWNNWVVGDGIAYHIEGGATPTLVERHPPNDTKLTTVVGRSDDEIYAVGGVATPTLLKWEGGAWQDVPVNLACANMGLNGVWTEPGENVWIAGFFGSMGQLKEDGSWDCATSPPTFETFHVVAKHGDEILFAGGNFLDQGGNYGTIGRFGTSDTILTATACE